MSHKITLLQFEYAWEVQSYLRFAGIHFEEQNAEYPSVDLTGELPQLQVDNVFLGKDNIINYLKENVENLDASFPEHIQNEIIVYTYMLRQYGNPSYNSYKLSKSKTIHNYLSSIYSSILSFPYNHLYYRKQLHLLDQQEGITISKDKKEREAMIDDLYRIFNEKLHESSTKISDDSQCVFLFGTKPSSLDAVLFNHLARIMEFPAGMHSCLVCYPGLVNYYELIMKRYFSAARGEKTSDNPFIKQYGFHISCQPTKNYEAILPFKDAAPRPFDLIENEEEELKETETKPTMEERMEAREQYVNYAGIGLLVFAAIMIIDLFFSVC